MANLKQTPIPVVPRTMKIVNADGTITRSGQLLLEQLQTGDAVVGGFSGGSGGVSALAAQFADIQAQLADIRNRLEILETK